MMPLCTCQHTWAQHEDGERCQMCWCRQYRAAELPTAEEKQEIVDSLHDALKKPDTKLKLKVPTDEIQ